MVTDQVGFSDASVAVLDDVSCMVCEHDTDRHDAIGRRYCEATQSNALQRSCICRPA